VAIDNKIELFKTKLEGRLAGGPHLLRRLFFHLDVDRSGKVDEKELNSTMPSPCQRHPSQPAISLSPASAP